MREWAAVQDSWHAMEETAAEHEVTYERVAFLPLDAFYAQPVDVYQLDKDHFDYGNRYEKSCSVFQSHDLDIVHLSRPLCLPAQVCHHPGRR